MKPKGLGRGLDALLGGDEEPRRESLGTVDTAQIRPGRYQPRVIKDRHDSYPRMTRPRSFLKKHPGYYGK